MVVVAILAALGAAGSNSLAAYLQQSADKDLSGDSVSLSDVPTLLRHPRWLFGQVFDVSAFLLQAVALAFGTLVFVEPMLVMSLPITVGLQAWSKRRRPGRLGVGGSLLCVVALSVFIGVGRPTAGASGLSGGEVLALWISVAVLLAVFLSAAYAARGNVRAVAFAAAASTVYGVTAGLTKVVTGQLQHGGIVAPLQSWELYSAIVTGVTGVLLTQNALKPGALAAPVAVITLGDPLVAIAIGLLWLGESVNDAPWAVVLEVLAIASMCAGIALLAKQSESASAPAAEEAGDGSDSDERPVEVS
jgi:F0F1-type ATP synthase assembly protein I